MNRNFLKLLLAAVLPLSAGTLSAANSIGSGWVDDVYYWFYDDGHAVVNEDVRHSDPDYSGRVVIPSTVTYKGTTYNVTEIGEYVFRDCPVTEVILPEGLKKIGRQQFWGCDNLKSITIPSSVTEIGFDAFNSNAENYYSDPAIEIITFEDGTEPLTGFNGSSDIPVAIQLGENVKTVYLGRDVLISRGENVENLTIGGVVTELDGGTDFFTANEALKTLTIEYGDAPLSLGRTNDGDGTFSKCPIETLFLDRQLEYDGTDGITPFSGSQRLSSVTIGDNVTSIDSNLFNGCSGMQSIVIGSGVASIGENAFLGCTGLQRVELKNLSAWFGFNFSSEEQNPLYYAKNLYMDGNLVTDLTVPSGVRSIPAYAFYGCEKIASVTIPSDVQTIGIWAFRGCTALKNLTLEDGGTLTLEYNGFSHRPFQENSIETLYLGRAVARQCFVDDLASLKELTVGNNITGFEEEYFENCKSLQEVHISNLSAWCRINFTDSLSNPLSMAHKLYVDGNLLTDLAIPSGISAVNPYAFYGGECFKSLSLHDGVTDMGEYAFYGCSGLSSLDLPAGVSTINRFVFAGCSNIEAVTIPVTVKNVYSSAFARCTGIRQVTFEDSQDDLVLKYYYDYPYSDTNAGDLFENSAIEKMYVGRDITLENPDYRIAVSSYLGSLAISGNVTKVGNIFGDASHTDTGLQTPNTPELIIEDSEEPLLVSEGAFLDIKGSDYYMYVGRNLKKDTEFKSSPFSYYLSSVEFGPNVTEIIPYMFDECCWYTIYGDVIEGLTEVLIDGDIESIGESAFADCGALARFDVPESVTFIGDNAFNGCIGLAYFDIPAATDYVGASAFEGCTGLTSLRFGSGSELGDIADRTFYGCTGLLSVTLPENVTEIGGSAFYGCTGLLSMTLPESVATIGESAFYGCSSLSVLSLGESLETIGESAFYNCSALTDLHLSQAVNSVGNRAFYGCLSLRTVRVDNPEPPVAYANTFSVDTYLNATLSVPSGSQDAYNMAECWYNFRNKEEFPFGSVGTIGDDALNVYFDGSELIVDGAGDDAVVEVYNIAGQRVYSGAVKPVALGKGLYIVRVAGRTFKVAL